MTNDQWTNPRAATNMTMIAKVEGLPDTGYGLLAFIGSDLVGVASPVTRHPSPVTEGEALYFLTIQSDVTGGTLRFETEDGESLEPFDVSKSRNIEISYIPDAHAGSLESPVILVPGNPSPVTGNPSPVTRKLIINDHVVIIRNGIRYDVTGKKLE